MSEAVKKELPEKWAWATFGDVADLLRGVSYKKVDTSSEPTPGKVPILRANNIGYGLNFDSLVYVPEKQVKEVQYIKKGDIIIAMSSGSKHLVGKAAQANDDFEGAYGAFCANLRVTADIEPKYVAYFYSSQDNLKRISGSSKGSNINNLRREHILSAPIPLAPPEQQKRIVAKIEELFSHIDAGIEALKKAKQLLKQYRQSVLKAAVTGELTKEWREANKDKLEPASQLLEHILKERRQKWEEQQLEQFKAKGKMQKDDKWKEKYIEPGVYEDIGYEIPGSWVMARAEQVCEFITKGTTPKKDKLSAGKGDVPFIKVYNLTFDTSLNFDVDPTFTDSETHKGFLARSKVYPGDVLMNIVGPPLGKVSIVSDLYSEWNINQAIAVYRTITGLSNKLLAYFLLSKLVVEWMLRKTKTTAGQVNLTLEISRNAPIPLMPEEEQREIVRLIEEKLNTSDKLYEELDLQLIKTEKNKQSILAYAFVGELYRENY
ncbi:MAG: restriction endonuclease subunit S [Candidatus Thiodiazotropha sp. LLP2]